MNQGEWVGTDHQYRVPSQFARIPEFDPRTGDHLWAMISMYRWTKPAVDTDDVLLDQENLLSVMGPGCYFCEEPYTSTLAMRRCKGQP